MPHRTSGPWEQVLEERAGVEEEVRIPAGGQILEGTLVVPDGAEAIVLFAHGSGSSRHSSRNRLVAGVLQEAKLGTLLFDLLSRLEEAVDMRTGHLRFDIGLLAERLVAATDWVLERSETAHLRVGYFGASTGGGAALAAAAARPEVVGAVVSRGGRPDLAGAALPKVKAPTLLLVGGFDDVVITLNEEALALLRCEKRLEIILGATHLFEEPGTLEQVAEHARDWFRSHLAPGSPP